MKVVKLNGGLIYIGVNGERIKKSGSGGLGRGKIREIRLWKKGTSLLLIFVFHYQTNSRPTAPKAHAARSFTILPLSSFHHVIPFHFILILSHTYSSVPSSLPNCIPTCIQSSNQTPFMHNNPRPPSYSGVDYWLM